MDEIKTRGIVLKKKKYRDNAALVDVFTQNSGILSAAAYGLHSVKSGMAGALQSFTYSEFTITQKGDNKTIKTASALESFDRINSSYEELEQAARLAKRAISVFGETFHEGAFELFYSALSFLSYSDMNPDDLYVYFLLHSMRITGQCPSVTECAVCKRKLFDEPEILFASRHGGAVCADCAGGRIVSRLSLEAMRRMLNVPFNEMNKIKLPQNVRDELLRLLDEYFSYWYK